MHSWRMMLPMSANQSSASAETCNPSDNTTVLIISSEPARIRSIEHALAESACTGITINIISIRAGTDVRTGKQPGLIILDAQDATVDPLHEVKRMRAALPDSRLILLYSTTDAVVASRALRAGAIAFLASREIPLLLVAAINMAMAGERFVSEEVMQGILHGMTENSENNTRIPIEVLSDREMMVFQLLGKGKCPRNIADELGVNIKTIATHCNNIRRKLHTPDNRHLTRISHDWAEGRIGTDGQSHD